jgi:hypothetical protein
MPEMTPKNNPFKAMMEACEESDPEMKYWYVYSGVRIYYCDRDPDKLVFRGGFCLAGIDGNKKRMKMYTTKEIRESELIIKFDVSVILDILPLPAKSVIIYFIGERKAFLINGEKFRLEDIDIQKCIEQFSNSRREREKTAI